MATALTGRPVRIGDARPSSGSHERKRTAAGTRTSWKRRYATLWFSIEVPSQMWAGISVYPNSSQCDAQKAAARAGRLVST